ncbi:DUF6455 family protein [Ponticoccus litoralis]|uniref:DUF6455 family protein n=1 Tax=Ponticoccus litoralis TaxID=422297 RepID=A0AAW9SQU0_9RHOB
MQSPSTLKRHAALVDDMASLQGLDLEEQMLRGTLSFSALEDAVLRCTGCTAPDRCAQWQAAHQGTRAAPPDYCRNAPLFASLQADKP